MIQIRKYLEKKNRGFSVVVKRRLLSASGSDFCYKSFCFGNTSIKLIHTMHVYKTIASRRLPGLLWMAKSQLLDGEIPYLSVVQQFRHLLEVDA